MEDKNKITINSDNISEYYGKINKLIDEYFAWSVTPSALKKFLKPGSLALKKFIERNELSNVVNINKIINDVVEDRYSMEKDGVLTFESFGQESVEDILSSDDSGTGLDFILYNNVEPTDLKAEKIIADYYRTSLGHINEVDKNLHEYTVDVLKGDYNVIIFSEEDFGKIVDNLVEYFMKYLSSKSVTVGTLNLNIKLSNLIDQEAILAMVDSKSYIVNIISEILNTHEYTYQKKFGDYHIWQR